MSLITVLIGVSGSGKSTKAKEILEKNPNAIRVNRDDLRLTLFGASQTSTDYYTHKHFKARENLVTETSDDIILNALNKGRDIVLDNTHLMKSYLVDDIIYKFNHLADIELEFMHSTDNKDLEVFKTRLKQRFGIKDYALDNGESRMGYIQKQWNQYVQLKRSMFNEQLFYPQTTHQVVMDKSLPQAILVDLDGTLALKGDRNIFDEEKVEVDLPNLPVVEVIKNYLKTNTQVIYLSGRRDSCRDQTMAWLLKHGLTRHDTKLFMRDSKDSRSDDIIKREIFDDNIRDNFNIIASFDDRQRVVRNVWNKLGIFCFDVNQGGKKF